MSKKAINLSFAPRLRLANQTEKLFRYCPILRFEIDRGCIRPPGALAGETPWDTGLGDGNRYGPDLGRAIGGTGADAEETGCPVFFRLPCGGIWFEGCLPRAVERESPFVLF
jgi:hypothetical protein